MKTPTWWPLTPIEITYLILGFGLVIALNVQWFLYYSNEGYPMESNVPPASWVAILMLVTISIPMTIGLSFMRNPPIQLRWFTSVPVFIAGMCNVMWLVTMFTSWFGSMSYPNLLGFGHWSCWMVGGGYWLGAFLIVPAAYIYGLKGIKSVDMAFQAASVAFILVSCMWYWDSWII